MFKIFSAIFRTRGDFEGFFKIKTRYVDHCYYYS